MASPPHHPETRESRALGILYRPADQLALHTFLSTSHLVGLVGRPTASLLLSHTAAFHAREIAPFLEHGKRIDVHLNRRLFARWMRDKRDKRDNPAVERDRLADGRAGGSFLYTLACCEFCWRAESLLWGAGIVCMRGLGPDDRDAAYLSVLRVLEVRWRAGRWTREGARAHVDQVLNERWAAGLLPCGELPAGEGPGRTAPCMGGCECGERKREVHLPAMPGAVPDAGRRGQTRRREIVHVQAMLPDPVDLDDVEDGGEDDEEFD